MDRPREWSDAQVQHAADAVIERMKRAQIFHEEGGTVRGDFVPADDPRPDLIFHGMDVDAKAVRAWLDNALNTSLAVLDQLLERGDGVSRNEVWALFGGMMYQSMLFGWELREVKPS